MSWFPWSGPSWEDWNRLNTNVEAVLKALTIIASNQQKEFQKMAALDDLKNQVAANTTVISSAVTLLQGLKKALDEAIAAGDMNAVKAIRDQIAADDSALAAAVVANTPAAPTPPLPPATP